MKATTSVIPRYFASLLYKLRLQVLNEVHIYEEGLREMLCFWSSSRNRVLKSGYLNLCCFEFNLFFCNLSLVRLQNLWAILKAEVPGSRRGFRQQTVVL